MLNDIKYFKLFSKKGCHDFMMAFFFYTLLNFSLAEADHPPCSQNPDLT
jgi:hypothetical protein